MAPDPDDLLAGLDDRQRLAVTCDELPVIVMAGAGSGKTRVLTRRIAWRSATGREETERVLALTFTRMAADELRHRLVQLGMRRSVRAGTMHAIGRWLLLQWYGDQFRSPPTVATSSSVCRRVTRSAWQARELASELSWARGSLVDPDGYPAAATQARRTTSTPAGELVELMVRYADEKRRRHVVDFDDMLAVPADLFGRDTAFAGKRYILQHVYLDELQDLTPLQHRFLTSILGRSTDLFAVGDPNQAIYGWAGSDNRYAADPTRWWPTATVVRLGTTYRSTPQVVLGANQALSAGGLALTVTGFAKADGPHPTITAHDDELLEAAHIARGVHDHHLPGRSWREQAVLARTNDQLDTLAHALRQAGIPYRGHGGDVAGDPVVRRMLARFREARGPFRDVAASFAAELEAEADRAAEDDSDRLLTSAADQLLNLLDEYERSEPEPSVDGFFGWLALTGAFGDDDADAVSLATLHTAKGLEWVTVHLAGCEDGLLPMSRAGDDDGEERRLFYVGCTRAMTNLHLHWARMRSVRGTPRRRRPSPYLGDLQRALEDVERYEHAATPPSLPRQHPAPIDDRVAALRAWRSQRARAAGVAPRAVLSDRALRALAEVDPGGPDEVAAVAGTGHLVAADLVGDLLHALQAGRR